MAVKWSDSYSVKWKLYSVNEDTWADGEDLSRYVSSMSISKDGTDSVPLLETGSASLDIPLGTDFKEGYYRIVAFVFQGAVAERHAIATLLMEQTKNEVKSFAFGSNSVSVQGRSVLAPAADRVCLAGTYAPRGANGAEWVRDLLEDCLNAEVEIIGDGFYLDDHITFSGGTSYLSMCWDVLDTGGWVMGIDGDGFVTIYERPEVPKTELNRITWSYYQPNFSSDKNLSSIPNRYIAVSNDLVEIVENHDPESETSYEARGRWVDSYDSSPKRINGESLYAYALRRLEEESTCIVKWTYKREFIPGLVPFDLIDAELPEYGINGYMRVLSQNYTLDKGITVSETVGIELKEFEA